MFQTVHLCLDYDDVPFRIASNALDWAIARPNPLSLDKDRV